MFFSFVFSHVWYSPGPLVPRTVLCPFYMIFRYLFIEWEQNTFLLKGVSGKTDMALTIEVSRPLSTQNSKVLPLIQPLISFPRRAGQPSYEAVRREFFLWAGDIYLEKVPVPCSLQALPQEEPGYI